MTRGSWAEAYILSPLAALFSVGILACSGLVTRPEQVGRSKEASGHRMWPATRRTVLPAYIYYARPGQKVPQNSALLPLPVLPCLFLLS